MRNTFIACLVVLGVVGCASEETAAPPTDVPQDSVVLQRPNPHHPDSLNMKMPQEWVVRLDHPDADAVIGAGRDSADIYFVNKSPGWHVTTGPAAIFYHPAGTADGTYRAEVLMHLFDPGDRTEAFGLFFGGQNLDEENQTYDYFLIRNSGEYLIKRREGGETSMIQDWTPHESINTFTAADSFSVANRLEIRILEEEAHFSVNGEQVAVLPRAAVQQDGIVGLRINHGLDVRVEDLSVTPL